MSIMVVQLVPEGILLGADRNITVSVQDANVVYSGQTPRPKVLKWPNRQIVVGYVGRAEVDGQPADEWLYDFIGRNLEDELPQIAHNLKDKLEFDLRKSADHAGMIVHLCGFTQLDGQWKPQVWFIRNAHGMNETGYTDVRAEFSVSEELQSHFQVLNGNEIRSMARERAKSWQPVWFHQGYDLGTFNMLDALVRQAMQAIVETHPGHPHAFPADLSEWSKHLKMAVLTYGAYFSAFHEPFMQYVGGGCDVVWAEWPKTDPID